VVAVAGQVGWNPVTHQFETDDFVGQVRQALLNVEVVLEAAGCTILDVVRVTWYLTDRGAYVANQKRVGEVWREVFGKHYPAMTLVIVAGLLEAKAKVEIEVTAVAASRAGHTGPAPCGSGEQWISSCSSFPGLACFSPNVRTPTCTIEARIFHIPSSRQCRFNKSSAVARCTL